MSSSSLKKLLSEKLNNPAPRDNPRIAIVGVGAELHGDDAAGIVTVRKLKKKVPDNPNILLLEGGTVPESITSPLRRFAPGRIFLVDACDLSEPAGVIRLVDPAEISGFSFSSHSLPLSLLAGFLQQELGCEVVFIGIQPESIELGERMSRACRLALNRLVRVFSQVVQSW